MEAEAEIYLASSLLSDWMQSFMHRHAFHLLRTTFKILNFWKHICYTLYSLCFEKLYCRTRVMPHIHELEEVRTFLGHIITISQIARVKKTHLSDYWSTHLLLQALIFWNAGQCNKHSSLKITLLSPRPVIEWWTQALKHKLGQPRNLQPNQLKIEFRRQNVFVLWFSLLHQASGKCRAGLGTQNGLNLNCMYWRWTLSTLLAETVTKEKSHNSIYRSYSIHEKRSCFNFTEIHRNAICVILYYSPCLLDLVIYDNGRPGLRNALWLTFDQGGFLIHEQDSFHWCHFAINTLQCF